MPDSVWLRNPHFDIIFSPKKPYQTQGFEVITCNIPQPSLVKQLFLPVSIAIASVWMTYKFTVYRERRHKKEHLNGVITVLLSLISRNLIDIENWLSKHPGEDRKENLRISKTNYFELFSQKDEYPKLLLQCTSIMNDFTFKNTVELIYNVQSNGQTVKFRGENMFISRASAENLIINFRNSINELTSYQRKLKRSHPLIERIRSK